MSTMTPTPCAQSKPSITMPTIKVNGHTISEKDLAEEVQYHSASSIDEALQKAGQALVIRQLMIQKAKEQGLSIDNEEDAFEVLVDSQVSIDVIKSEDCYRYYQQNLPMFVTAPILEVSHILLAAAPDDIERRLDKKQQAQQLIKELSGDLSLFSQYAADHSDCPSSATFGSLGQISKGQTVPEFERQLFLLDEGLHAFPLESRYGFHIVLVNRKIDGEQLSFSMVAEKIRDYLTHRRYRQAIGDFLYRMVEVSDIEGITLELEQDNIFLG